jgi:hypothetical protein
MQQSSRPLHGGGALRVGHVQLRGKRMIRTTDASGLWVDLELGCGPALLAVVGDVDDHTWENRIFWERETRERRTARSGKLNMHAG